MRWVGREMRDSYIILAGRRKLKSPLGRLGHRWEGNIKMGFKEVMCRLNSSGS
jgi:hypothetical protein